MQTANVLMSFAGSKETPINVDDTGLGGGVTDMLKKKGYNAIPINFGNPASEPDKFVNTATEMWFNFADEYLDICDIPYDVMLKDELTNRLYVYDKKERKGVAIL